MKGLFAFTTLAVLFSSGAAHTIFQELHVNGVSAGHTVGIRVPSYNGPIENVNSNDIICNGGVNPYRAPVSQAVIPVPAGAQVTAEWHYTLDGATGGTSDPIDPSHKGPVLAYLAKVPSATQTSVTGLKWFKIYHDGYDAASNTWAVDKLGKDKGKVSFKIPDCIEAGEYLLRVELIALHGAQSYPGAQFYMECAQIKISGGGNVSPATVSFPGAYSGTDPGVKVNIYSGLKSYTIPGPSVFTCAAGGDPIPVPSVSRTTINPPVASTTVNPPVASSSVPSTPAPGTVPQWGQCGGATYSGPTDCISPFKCTKSNDYYSQCL